MSFVLRSTFLATLKQCNFKASGKGAIVPQTPMGPGSASPPAQHRVMNLSSTNSHTCAPEAPRKEGRSIHTQRPNQGKQLNLPLRPLWGANSAWLPLCIWDAGDPSSHPTVSPHEEAGPPRESTPSISDSREWLTEGLPSAHPGEHLTPEGPQSNAFGLNIWHGISNAQEEETGRACAWQGL